MTHASFQGMRASGKQDEAWILSRLTKQLTDMGFLVTGVSLDCFPPRVLPCSAPVVSCPRLSRVPRETFEGGERPYGLTPNFPLHECSRSGSVALGRGRRPSTPLPWIVCAAFPWSKTCRGAVPSVGFCGFVFSFQVG